MFLFSDRWQNNGRGTADDFFWFACCPTSSSCAVVSPLCLGGMPGGLFFVFCFFKLIYFFQNVSSIQKGPANLCLRVGAQTFAHVRAISTLQLLYFLAQLCRGDLFNDKCSRWELARACNDLSCHWRRLKRRVRRGGGGGRRRRGGGIRQVG